MNMFALVVFGNVRLENLFAKNTEVLLLKFSELNIHNENVPSEDFLLKTDYPCC